MVTCRLCGHTYLAPHTALDHCQYGAHDFGVAPLRVTMVSSMQPFEGHRFGWQTPENEEERAKAYAEWVARGQVEKMRRIRNKERNMMDRLERRRAAIRGKWKARGNALATGFLAGTIALIVLPITGTAIALAWNALWAVLL